MAAQHIHHVPATDDRVASIVKTCRTLYTGPVQGACIAGSGFHAAFSDIPRIASFPYAELEGMPGTTVQGHANSLDFVRFGETVVAIFLGRFHLYDGHPPANVILPVRIAAELGSAFLVCTNAAGGLRSTFHVADLMLADALINRSGHRIVVRTNYHERNRTRGTELTDALWTQRVWTRMSEHSWLQRGAYCSVSGPSYETRAEIGLFSTFADAIGMSTVHEMQAAQDLGMQAMAFSLISNCLPPPVDGGLSHSEVLAAAERAGPRIVALLETCIKVAGERDAR